MMCPGRSLPALLLPLMLTALVSLACGNPPSVSHDPRDAARPAAAPEPLSPRGEVGWPFEFRWKRVPGGEWVYRVTVVDAAERTLVERDTKDDALQPGPDVKALVTGDGPFAWRVAILDDNGRALVASPPVTFRLR